MTPLEWTAAGLWGFLVIACLLTVAALLAQIRDKLSQIRDKP